MRFSSIGDRRLFRSQHWIERRSETNPGELLIKERRLPVGHRRDRIRHQPHAINRGKPPFHRICLKHRSHPLPMKRREQRPIPILDRGVELVEERSNHRPLPELLRG